MSTLTEISILFLEGIIKNISCEHRDCESFGGWKEPILGYVPKNKTKIRSIKG